MTTHERMGAGQDGQIIVSSFQHIINVWKNWEMEHRRSFSCILKVMISPDNSLLLSQDESRRGDFHRLWNLQTGELIRVFETSPYWFADAIANTADGSCIVSGIRDNSVKVSDLNTDQVIYSFPACSPTAMTPDGKVLAYCNDTNEIILWDLEVNQGIRTLPGNPSPIRAICLSSDRQWVVSYDAEHTIRVYGLRDE